MTLRDYILLNFNLNLHISIENKKIGNYNAFELLINDDDLLYMRIVHHYIIDIDTMEIILKD